MSSVELEPPGRIENDWKFFLKHTDGRRFEIDSYFDEEKWKIDSIYRMRIITVYDPSHFWVVSAESEMDALHKYIYSFYSKYQEHYKIATKYFKLNMYCVTFIEGAFYRSRLVNVPLAAQKGQNLASVYLLDYGLVAYVTLDKIYFMTKELYSVPQFAVRATLSGLCPKGSPTWPTEAVNRFKALVLNKVSLCQVTARNYPNKILHLNLGEYDGATKSMNLISDVLVNENLAIQITLGEIKAMKHVKRPQSEVEMEFKMPFLSPQFDKIEKGVCLQTSGCVSSYLPLLKPGK